MTGIKDNNIIQQTSTENKLTLKDKFGYGSAATGDAVAYMFLNTFLLFFLTTVAGIQPVVAGTITIIGTIWNALMNPIIGYISDNARTKWGRRRPYMVVFCLPLLLGMTLLFTSFQMPYSFKVAYYCVMIIVFWTGYTGFFVPYYALGAEYTNDYSDRTSIRAFASFFNVIGTVFSMVMPTYIVEILERSFGFSDRVSWALTSLLLAVISVISILITVGESKHVDVCCEEEIKEESHAKAGGLALGRMFREYFDVMKLKPMKWLLLSSCFYLVAFTIAMTDLVYLMTYNCGFSGTGVSLGMLCRSAGIGLCIPVYTKLCKILDKRSVHLAVIGLVSVGLLLIRMVNSGSILELVLVIGFLAIMSQSYWQTMPATFYDLCEYDEYYTGKRREGAILSVQGLVEAIASGIGSQLLGVILQISGFDGAVSEQSELALEWVFNCSTVVPVVFLVLSAITFMKFPITKKYYNNIINELERRKNGLSQ